MIHVAVEIRERTVVRRVRITAESMGRALELCDGNVRVVYPMEPESFFAPKDAARSVEYQPTGMSERRLVGVGLGDLCPSTVASAAASKVGARYRISPSSPSQIVGSPLESRQKR
jgi:hypothetical protein